MKTQISSNKAKENLPKGNKSTRAEIRDNLDHRSGEEQNDKGAGQTTHNVKEKHNQNKKN